MAAIFDDLDPSWKPIALAIDADLKARNVRYTAFSGRRIYVDQNIAFKNKASQCDGIIKISLHQAGLATDWVAIDDNGRPTWDYIKFADVYKDIRDTIIRHGGEAGGTWMPSPYESVGLGWDPPHGQIKA